MTEKLKIHHGPNMGHGITQSNALTISKRELSNYSLWETGRGSERYRTKERERERERERRQRRRCTEIG